MIEPSALARDATLEKVKALTAAMLEQEIASDELDGLVLDCATEQSTEVNNGGQPSQLEYLIRNGWTTEDIMGRLKPAPKVVIFTTLTFASAQWGYLHDMVNLHTGEDQSIRGGAQRTHDGHVFNISAAGDRISPGVTGTYGKFRGKPDEDEPEFDELDYYVAMSDGERDGRPLISTSVNAGSFYSERLFVYGTVSTTTGKDEVVKDMPRAQILEQLADMGLCRTTRSHWNPTTPWRGYNKGWPTFHTAITAATEHGPTFGDVVSAVEKRDVLDHSYYPGCRTFDIYKEVIV